MGVSRRQAIAQKLLEVGRSLEEPVAFIENGTTSEERLVVCSLGELAENPPEVKPPAVMVVGQVVNLSKVLKQKLLEGVVR